MQTGIARTGKLLASCGNCSCEGHCENKYETRPDILILGKALSGGTLPVSAVLADDEVMMCLKPGSMVQPLEAILVCAVAKTALEVVRDEELSERAEVLGKIFRAQMQELVDKSPLVSLVRARACSMPL